MKATQSTEFDVAIIGGGPAGSTCGSLLRKYHRDARVVILEKDSFPREHVGESQLPLVSEVLNEMGAWDAVEAAGFPIKIGATYRWGRTDELWDFEFLPGDSLSQTQRPGRYEGQRKRTAFQVERSIYDKILLDHAASLGCEVRQPSAVRQIVSSGDRIDGLALDGNELIRAKWYVDATGSAATLRRAMGVETDTPTHLKNVAFWNYWDNAEWAVTIGDEATRVNVMSLGYGWLWFIPISKTRASIGLVIPASKYRELGKKQEDLYYEAIRQEPLINSLTAKAEPSPHVRGTKDWSFVSERMAGENWFLVGESAGFADPILAAGLTLTQVGAKELACVLGSLLTNEHPHDWLARTYEDLQIRRIRQHIRFADYWYTANDRFTDLKEFTREIARDAGLELDADQAFQWLGTGGFVNDDWRVARVAAFSLGSMKQLAQRLGEGDSSWNIAKFDRFVLNKSDQTVNAIPIYHRGRVEARQCWVRGSKRLPMVGAYAKLAALLETERSAADLQMQVSQLFPSAQHYTNAIEVLEAMLHDGWVIGRDTGVGPKWQHRTPQESEVLHSNRDIREPAH